MKCPYCGHSSYEVWEEEEYENSNDPTPEYGGALVPTTFEDCANCGCDNFSS